MLGKLLKYEFKATMRIFMPMYIALMAVAMVNRIFQIGDIEMGFGISTAILVALFTTLGIITIVMIVQRFNRNLLGDEGYLMFTLPVKSESLIFSKIIISIVWTILSGIVACITAFILVGTIEEFIEVISNLDIIWAEISMITIDGEVISPIMVMGSIGLMSILTYVLFILQIYLSLAVAQLPKLSKHRRIVAFIAFIVINIVMSIFTGEIGSNIPEHMFESFMSGAIAINGYIFALCALLFVGTKFLLDCHLNLE